MPTEDMGWGTTLAFLTGTALVAYTTWKIHNRREELRETIELLRDAHAGFIDDLEAMAAAGVLKENHG